MAIRIWKNYDKTYDLCLVHPDYGHTIQHLDRFTNFDEAAKALSAYIRKNPKIKEF